ncbi:MAG: HAMP domain-containing sensor histidine kinase [Dissulfuribacterales bacterium]
MLHEALYSAIVCLAVFLGYRLATYRFSAEISLAKEVTSLLDRLKRIAGIEDISASDDVISRIDAWLQQFAFQHNLLKEIAKITHDGVLILRNDTILFINPVLMRMLNIPGCQEKWLGRSLLEICRYRLVQKGVSEWQDSKEKQSVVLEMQEGVFNVEIFGIMDDSLVMLLWQDITAVRKADAHGKELVANVAHQLRTPITVIRGYAETLLDNESCDESALRRFLEVILRNSKRLSRFIEDILTISMLDNKGITQKEPMEIAELLAAAIEMTMEEARAKGVKIDVENKVSNDVVIYASSLMEQAVFNVLHNAIKYTPSNSTVRVLAAANHQRVLLSITDQGPGIPQEMRRLIFDRFFRIASGPQPAGSGLGLAIAKEVITAHGGRIYVENEGNAGGSTFVIELPLTASPS